MKIPIGIEVTIKLLIMDCIEKAVTIPSQKEFNDFLSEKMEEIIRAVLSGAKAGILSIDEKDEQK